MTNIGVLYHHVMCPISRQVSVYLNELKLKYEKVNIEYWRIKDEFLKIHPAHEVPMLKLNIRDGIKLDNPLYGIYSITEYLIGKYEDFDLMPEDISEASEVRNYLTWFNYKFYREVSKILLDEKMIKLYTRYGPPDMDKIKMAKHNFRQHMDFLTSRLDNYSYLVSNRVTCADIAAASHIALLDYFSEINWNYWHKVRLWYSLIKSRISFRVTLKDDMPGFNPPDHYRKIDF